MHTTAIHKKFNVPQFAEQIAGGEFQETAETRGPAFICCQCLELRDSMASREVDSVETNDTVRSNSLFRPKCLLVTRTQFSYVPTSE